MFIDIFDSLVVLIVFDLVDSNAGKPATYFVGILQIKIKIKIKMISKILSVTFRIILCNKERDKTIKNLLFLGISTIFV